MKVLHYSDKSSPDFVNLYQKSNVLFSTGDLTLFDFIGIKDQVIETIPMYGVYGNHDSGNYMKDVGIIDVHENIVKWNGYKIGGFQGCLRYKNSGIMFDEIQAKNFADNFPYVDILLLHAGPKDILDDPSDPVHVGSENIKRYVSEKKPKYVFCGHQYTNAETRFGQTMVFRTYGARIIDIE